MKRLNPGWLYEIVIVTLIFAFAGNLGFERYLNNNQSASFYQSQFGAAVTLACGRGFVDVDPFITQELGAFLSKVTDTFDCDNLPDQLTTRERDHWADFQEDHFYLLGAAALTWKLTGVSWTGLSWLIGLLYAFFMTFSYGLFRLGMGRPTAFVITMLFMVSTLQVSHLIHYRDFSKAPFILGAIFFTCFLVTKNVSRNSLLMISSLTGALLGIGIGFRLDALICLPFFLMSFLFIKAGNVFVDDLKNKAFAISLFFISFFLAGLPVLLTLSGGSNSWHVALVGLVVGMDPGVELSQLYKTVRVSADGYIQHIVTGQERLINGSSEYPAYQTGEYDAACARLYFDIAKHFPADFIARVYSLIYRVLDLPFHAAYPKPPVSGDVYLVFHKLRAMLFPANLHGVGIFFVTSAIVAIMVQSSRLGIFAILFLGYFCGYPVIQSSIRHYFHLEFVTLWAIGFLISGLFLVVRRMVITEGDEGKANFVINKKHASMRIAAISFGLVLLAPGLLYSARAYQTSHLKDIFNEVITREGEAVKMWEQKWTDTETIVWAPPIPRYRNLKDEWYVDTFYIRAEFDMEKCGKNEINIRSHYHGKKGSNDYSAAYTIRAPVTGSGKTLLAMPVFDSSNLLFSGFGMQKEDIPCLDKVYHIKDVSGFPLLLYLNLPVGWENEPLYSTMRF